MHSFHHITIYCLIIALTASCGHNNSAPQYARHKDSTFNGRGPLLNFDDSNTILLPDDEPYEFEKYGTIDFFGKEMVGPINSIIDSIASIDFIDIIGNAGSRYHLSHDDDLNTCYSATVMLANIPCSMNILYDKAAPDYVDEILFITSDSTIATCDIIMEKLSSYYDLADIIDTDENSYTWLFNLGFLIRFRHLHGGNYGWTFYFIR